MSEMHPEQPDEPRRRRDQPGAGNPHAPWARFEEVGDIYSVEINGNGAVERADKLTLRPMVWIGCLAAYNGGTLHGEWVDAAVEGNALVAAAKRILASSPEPGAEEWAIFDYDDFGSYRVAEFDTLEHVAVVARGIAQHGPAYAAWAEPHGGDESMLDQFEDAYLGEYESAEAWAREVLADLNLDDPHRLGALPESIRPYLHIDYQGWARDAELAGDVHLEGAPGGGVYVFAVR